jgi:hypothetical protein
MGLLDRHRELLEARGIHKDVIEARGYDSTSLRKWLRELGFSQTVSALGPGLVIPVWDAFGKLAFHQFRPDSPRRVKGKLVKYETPFGARLVVDVPPQARARLANPSEPLFVTESPLKADAGASAGLVCVATFGVRSWKGRNKYGGKTALADWGLGPFALDDREVFLAPDSDMNHNPDVAGATAGLGRLLERYGASVHYIYLPAAGNGAKQGLDDWLAQHEGIEAIADGLMVLASDEPPVNVHPRVYTPVAVAAQAHTPPSWVADQDILGKLVGHLGVCGLVGETRNAKLVYLAVASQVLGDPVSLVMKGLSSSGKSFTVETVLRFVPEDALIVMTAMSEHALIYLKEEFAHRTLVLYEATALREEREKAEGNVTAYLVRSLLSEGQIRYPVTIRDPATGEFTTKFITREGPTNFVVTTTATSLHAENETRMLSLPADDSAEQTRAVLLALAVPPGKEPPFGEWHDLFWWLKEGPTQVTVPYAGYLARAIPPVAVRLRRDFRAVLRLIETHALLHRKTREARDGAVVATEADYLAVRGLVEDLISDAAGATVPASTRETVEAVARLTTAAKDANGKHVPAKCWDGATVHHIATELEIERSRAQRRLKAARERGYIKNAETKRGLPGRYLPDAELPGEAAILPERVCGAQCAHPCPAFCEGPPGQEGVCACAGAAQG